jgi:hypothetical protein
MFICKTRANAHAVAWKISCFAKTIIFLTVFGENRCSGDFAKPFAKMEILGRFSRKKTFIKICENGKRDFCFSFLSKRLRLKLHNCDTIASRGGKRKIQINICVKILWQEAAWVGLVHRTLPLRCPEGRPRHSASKLHHDVRG